MTSPDNNIDILSGDWAQGRLEGLGRIVYTDSSITEGWFRAGCLHGLVRKMVMKKFRTFKQHVSWLGRYDSGVPRDTCWEWQERVITVITKVCPKNTR